MENQTKLGVVITLFIMLILGIILASSVADQVWVAGDGIYNAENEVITIANGTAVNLANDWVTSFTSLTIENGSANYTLASTRYDVANLNSDDIATVTLNTTEGHFDGNTSYVNYTWQDNSYVRHTQSRVLMRLLLIFFVLGVFAIAILGLSKMGIFDIMK
jgi:hypothetical protein